MQNIIVLLQNYAGLHYCALSKVSISTDKIHAIIIWLKIHTGLYILVYTLWSLLDLLNSHEGVEGHLLANRGGNGRQVFLSLSLRTRKREGVPQWPYFTYLNLYTLTLICCLPLPKQFSL